MVWDTGTWTCEGDARKALAKGHLQFSLSGKKLKGSWHLVRTKRLADDHHGNKAGKGWVAPELGGFRNGVKRLAEHSLRAKKFSTLPSQRLAGLANAPLDGCGQVPGERSGFELGVRWAAAKTQARPFRAECLLGRRRRRAYRPYSARRCGW